MEKEIIITPEIEEQNIDVIAEQGVFPTGTIYINENGITDVSSYANANVDVSVNLQNKKVDINENGTTTITADSGYGGLNEVEVDVNVSASPDDFFYSEIKYVPNTMLQWLKVSPDLYITNDTTTLANMFNNWKLNKVPRLHFGTNITNMSGTFQACFADSIDTTYWDTSKVTSFNNTFNSCHAAIIDISNLDCSSLTVCSSMFQSNYAEQIILGNFDTSKCSSFLGMFAYSKNLVNLDANNLDTGKVTNMQSCFESCVKLTNLNVKDWNVEKVTNMYRTFYEFGRNENTATKLDLSGWKTSALTNANEMFNVCFYLEELDISNFDFSNITNHQRMFNNCGRFTTTGLTKVYVKDATAQQWILNLSSTDRPSTWTTANVVIKN